MKTEKIRHINEVRVIWPGSLYAVFAYSSWGLFPLYWILFLGIEALEVLVHRILWSFFFLMLLLALKKKFPELLDLRREPRLLVVLLLISTLLGGNWLIYIWAINARFVIGTSLGYFINPLFNVMLGLLVLKERFNPLQSIAHLLALSGVLDYLWGFGKLPCIALGLAGTFAFYGLLRKMVDVGPLIGLTAETTVLLPVAIALLSLWGIEYVSHFGSKLLDLYFIGCGLVTSMPLVWFANAVKRLRFSTLGLFQYIAPSIHLIMGVFVFDEAFKKTHTITFALIWDAMLLYSGNILFQKRSG